MEKITKKQMFEGMVAYFRGEETEIAEEAFAQFCLAQIADLDKKSAKAKERAEKKKAEADILTDLVYSVMTNKFQTGAEIATAVEEAFKVEVADVNTINVKRKPKRRGVMSGYTAEWKKAIVTLTEKSGTIEFFDGMM